MTFLAEKIQKSLAYVAGVHAKKLISKVESYGELQQATIQAQLPLFLPQRSR
jgi:hypothetical protein